MTDVRGSIVIFGGDIAIFRGCMIRDIVATGWRVVACGPDDADQAQSISRLGADYIAVATDRTGLSPSRDVRSIASLAAILGRIKPDVFFSFHTKYNVIGPLAAFMAGVPRIYSLIAGLGYAFSPGSEFRRKAVRAILSSALQTSLRCCTGVFVQNPDDQALVRTSGWVRRRTPVVCVPGTGVDLEHFRYVAPPAPPLRILLVARLMREKGVLDFVEAARLIKRDQPACSFDLLGSFETNPGALSTDVVEGWRREGVITYVGSVKDVRPHLHACSIMALPSYYREGVPKSVLEAMATGRAIITTDTPGCRDTVVDSLNGFLVPPRDPPALAAAIKRFIDDPSRVSAMGRESRRRAQSHFDVRSINKQMMEVMQIRAG